MSRLVRSAMRTQPTTVGRSYTLAQALDLMDIYQCILVCVVDAEGVLQGVVSEGDIWRAYRAGTRLNEGTVGEIMAQPISVTDTDDCTSAADLLERQGIARAPVLSEGHLVGLVGRVDLARAAVEE